MPELHYWITGAAIFLPVSFAISLIIGPIPLMEGRNRILIGLFLAVGFTVTMLGWWVAANQETKSERDSQQLTETKRNLDTVDGQISDLVVKMNRQVNPIPAEELVVLAPGTPEWVKIAHKELGQHEIPGPEENHHIVKYFKSVGAKENYRDDIDDWASAFVEWSLNQAGVAGPKSDHPLAWLSWGRSIDRPTIGCIVIMSFSGLSHVGFYFGEDVDFVRVLGGNQDDAVHIFRYPKNSVLAYRWPMGIDLPHHSRKSNFLQRDSAQSQSGKASKRHNRCPMKASKPKSDLWSLASADS
jgi:uncharacterized protein (TIGR02594 family)